MINLKETYWERITGYFTELRVDVRWILKNVEDDKPYGNLRIVSHPDLSPGYLRAIFTYITSINNKTKGEQIQTIEDYQMSEIELEVYSIDKEIGTETKTYEAPYKELEDIFGVKIFS